MEKNNLVLLHGFHKLTILKYCYTLRKIRIMLKWNT